MARKDMPMVMYADLPEMCTPEEIAAFLRLGRNTVYEQLKSGAIPSIKYGRLIRIPKSALMESKS